MPRQRRTPGRDNFKGDSGPEYELVFNSEEKIAQNIQDIAVPVRIGGARGRRAGGKRGREASEAERQKITQTDTESRTQRTVTLLAKTYRHGRRN